MHDKQKRGFRWLFLRLLFLVSRSKKTKEYIKKKTVKRVRKMTITR